MTEEPLWLCGKAFVVNRKKRCWQIVLYNPLCDRILRDVPDTAVFRLAFRLSYFYSVIFGL